MERRLLRRLLQGGEEGGQLSTLIEPKPSYFYTRVELPREQMVNGPKGYLTTNENGNLEIILHHIGYTPGPLVETVVNLTLQLIKTVGQLEALQESWKIGEHGYIDADGQYVHAP